ncbi:MAG: ATP phosphoribosyltransferase regulatory subunit [Gammaproteobacteria bacterium]|nr:ATP phosphoribosyltransferase regulatory subunit [Gammaproteobacteria bacterium]MBI5615983.1 ATP phosphoribosyltransferase regulatory subunit [Gammaproteobacteria bacterium]
MKRGDRWLLPDGVDEVLPPQAETLETLRRTILDLFRSWGYELVLPPLVEFLESLLSGIGEDLDLQTFKLTDQVSGRLMGVPADITPQVARIDAHRLASPHPRRLCYLGPVLHTKPDKFAGSRNPLQLGAELYGHQGIESDAEVVCLMVEVLRAAGLLNVTVELGHMGVFKGLVAAAALPVDDEGRLLDALLRKAADEVHRCVHDSGVEPRLADCLCALLELNGGPDVAVAARSRLQHAPAAVLAALGSLAELIGQVQRRNPTLDLHVDFAELRGYRYHTGVMFAAYTPSLGRAIACGGRYDNIGRLFGKARPATGFSTDLKTLAALSGRQAAPARKVFAPAGTTPELLAAIASQRAAGDIVIQELPGQSGSAAELGCAARLELAGSTWSLRELNHKA